MNCGVRFLEIQRRCRTLSIKCLNSRLGPMPSAREQGACRMRRRSTRWSDNIGFIRPSFAAAIHNAKRFVQEVAAPQPRVRSALTPAAKRNVFFDLPSPAEASNERTRDWLGFAQAGNRSLPPDQGAGLGSFRIMLYCGSDGRSAGRILAIGVVVSVVDCSALLLIKWLRGLR